jgi:hypothetical protein
VTSDDPEVVEERDRSEGVCEDVGSAAMIS